MATGLFQKGKNAAHGAWAILIFLGALALSFGALFSVYSPPAAISCPGQLPNYVWGNSFYQAAPSTGYSGLYDIGCAVTSINDNATILYYNYSVAFQSGVQGSLSRSLANLYIATPNANKTTILNLNGMMQSQIAALVAAGGVSASDGGCYNGWAMRGFTSPQVTACLLNTSISYNRQFIPTNSSMAGTTTIAQQSTTTIPYTPTQAGLLQQIEQDIQNFLASIGL